MPSRQGSDTPSARYYMHSSNGMPHRSGELGDYARSEGFHFTAREMADLQRSGSADRIRRMQKMLEASRRPIPDYAPPAEDISVEAPDSSILRPQQPMEMPTEEQIGAPVERFDPEFFGQSAGQTQYSFPQKGRRRG